MKEIAFHKLLLDLFLNPKKAKKYHLDKRLTNTEKNVIEGFLKIRDNQNHEAIELLQNTAASDLLFVESQRLYALGMAANNISQYQLAEKTIYASIEILKNLNQHYFHFSSYFALFWIYANLNEPQKMQSVLNKMESIPVVNDYQKRRLLRAQFTYFQKIQDNANALVYMAKLETLRDQFSESDSIYFLVDKFILLIQMEDLSQAYTVLEDMKNFRKYQLTENYKFMKKLLDHLTKNDPIYAYDKDFEQVPFLLHQIKVIQYLEENNFEMARRHWHCLKEIAPATYEKEFVYAGNKCLFSLGLAKHQDKLIAAPTIQIDPEASKHEMLISLLTNSQIPLSGGYLFESIWGRLPNDKEDLMKISRLVSRVKTQNNIDIENRKGTYQIKKSLIKKAS